MREQRDPRQLGEKKPSSDGREPGVAGVVSNAYSAIRQQIVVVGSELSSAMDKVRIGVGVLVIGAGLVLIGSALIPFLLVDLVRYLAANQIPAWGAYGTVALLFIAIGVGIMSYSLASFQRVGENFSDALSKVGRVGDNFKSDLHSRVVNAEAVFKEQVGRVEDLRKSFDIPYQAQERPWVVVGTAMLGGVFLRRIFVLAQHSGGDVSGGRRYDVRADLRGGVGVSGIVQLVKRQIDQNKNLFVRAGVGLLIALVEKGLGSQQSSETDPLVEGSGSGSQEAGSQALRDVEAAAESLATATPLGERATESTHRNIRVGERTIH